MTLLGQSTAVAKEADTQTAWEAQRIAKARHHRQLLKIVKPNLQTVLDLSVYARDAVSRPCDQPLTLPELRSPSGWNLLDRQRGGPGHCGLDLLTHFSL